jgi:hypothetical protein
MLFVSSDKEHVTAQKSRSIRSDFLFVMGGTGLEPVTACL